MFRAILNELKDEVSSMKSDTIKRGVSSLFDLWLRSKPLITNYDISGIRINSIEESSKRRILLIISVITFAYFSAKLYLNKYYFTLKIENVLLTMKSN